MQQDRTRALLARAVPFAMAMALVLLTAAPTSALFGRGREETPTTAEGAPIARSSSARVYRGIPYTGTLSAVGREGEALRYSLVSAPKKGTLTLEGDTFVYTGARDRIGADSFTYTAEDASGRVSAPAVVSLTLTRSRTGVEYDDMDGSAAYTAAVDLAERGIFVGAQVGAQRFFEPERAVTRGEFVAMALACAGVEVEAQSLTGFSDDAELPAWAKGCAVSALQGGLIRGVDTAEGVAFRASREVTLSEAAAVLDRLLRVTDVDMSRYEGENAEAWCAQAVANLESVRVLASGSFSGGDWQRALTRAEAAQLLSAAMTLAEGKTGGGRLAGIFQ